MKTLASAILVICLVTGVSWSWDNKNKSDNNRHYVKPTQEQIDAVTAKMAEIKASMQTEISPQKKQRLQETYSKLARHKEFLLKESDKHEKQVRSRFSNFLDEQKLTNKQKENITNAYGKMRKRRASRIARHKAKVRKAREQIGK